ncbi:MAG TPA: hypothetical protein VE441_06330 [Mycobacterium sp.]|nr:hypothetical protein [Mycobacterium sp.]
MTTRVPKSEPWTQGPGIDWTTRRRGVVRGRCRVEAERLEPGELLLLARMPEQREEVGQGGRELAVVGQRHLFGVGLGALDREVIEAFESCGDRVDGMNA